MTRWAAEVDPDAPHPEYPRPQMVREDWQSLNGRWDHAIRPRGEQRPEAWDGPLLVPFPVESALSGVMKTVGPENELWYRRTFESPRRAATDRLLLHFGAVDWKTTVWVNGREVGEHVGGYDPFTLDITEALLASDPQELVVRVWDPSDGSHQPRGKQIRRPHGIWYTPTTGIWQSVWLEPVPRAHMVRTTPVPRLDDDSLDLGYVVAGTEGTGWTLRFRAAWESNGRKTAVEKASTISDRPLTIELTEQVRSQWWTPDSPHLIDYTLELLTPAGEVADTIRGYFGMRKIALGKDEAGRTRLLLNNSPLFQYGPLDQGFWPDGLYTPPTDAALKYDLEVTKRLGFNMVRKHVKVEADRWYTHCDRMGLLVWQDMPSGDRYIGANDPDIERTPESIANFEQEWHEIMDDLAAHPCIVMWVPFNEGWGQFDTARIVELTRQWDPTRLVNNASGWSDRGVGDVHDVHIYPGPGMAPLSARASVLGEFGGLGLPLEGHTWQAKDNWGYRSFTNREDLQSAYLGLIGGLRPLIGEGLAAAVYTQTTDVEVEVNGLMTYDRATLKFDEEALAAAHRRLYLPPPQVRALLATSQQEGATWKYSTENSAERWMAPDFDASAWREGPGGFGEPSTPGSQVRTMWKSDDIWLRRRFTVDADRLGKLGELALQIHHDEDAEVYLNGERIAAVKGYSTQYYILPLPPAAQKLLRAGANTLAVHCKQTGGGQYIDVGIIELVDAKTSGRP